MNKPVQKAAKIHKHINITRIFFSKFVWLSCTTSATNFCIISIKINDEIGIKTKPNSSKINPKKPNNTLGKIQFARFYRKPEKKNNENLK